MNTASSYRSRQKGCPGTDTASGSVLRAVLIARKYPDRAPTSVELQLEFGMSDATARRWRAAFRAAGAPAR